YQNGGQALRRMGRELLFEQRWPIEARESVRGLRLATLDELALVMPVQAEMAFAESGVNPLEKDPSGFRLRCARRIEQGRVWVLVKEGRLIFKADIMAETPAACYLEGIYVAPEYRGQGYGGRCLSQLSRTLLSRAGSVSLMLNELNKEAASFYQKAGFKLRGTYDTIFLQQETAGSSTRTS
ncbi:MAG TPA: GNAT family N-acetyltransferase, partial [Pyrinomonadaceae bacterium]